MSKETIQAAAYLSSRAQAVWLVHKMQCYSHVSTGSHRRCRYLQTSAISCPYLQKCNWGFQETQAHAARSRSRVPYRRTPSLRRLTVQFGRLALGSSGLAHQHRIAVQNCCLTGRNIRVRDAQNGRLQRQARLSSLACAESPSSGHQQRRSPFSRGHLGAGFLRAPS